MKELLQKAQEVLDGLTAEKIKVEEKSTTLDKELEKIKNKTADLVAKEKGFAARESFIKEAEDAIALRAKAKADLKAAQKLSSDFEKIKQDWEDKKKADEATIAANLAETDKTLAEATEIKKLNKEKSLKLDERKKTLKEEVKKEMGFKVDKKDDKTKGKK